MRTIKKCWDFACFNENTQNARHKLMLANVGEEVRAISPPFKCREYYGDALYTVRTKVGMSQYGFNTKDYPWKGKHVITTYLQPADTIMEKLKIMNDGLKGTVPEIVFEQLDMGKSLDEWGTPTETCGFLVKVPEWYHATLVRSSLFTALLRTLFYKNPLDVRVEESYAEACVTQMHKKRFPDRKPYKDTLWNLIFFPALNLKYNNILGISDQDYEDFMTKAKVGRGYGIHSTTGIYTMWNTLFQYMSRPNPAEEFDKLEHFMMNKDVLGNLIAFSTNARNQI